MVACGVSPIIIRCITHITDNILMFSCFIDTAVKCPSRSVPEDTGDKP
jgi:hypothetical protein